MLSLSRHRSLAASGHDPVRRRVLMGGAALTLTLAGGIAPGSQAARAAGHSAIEMADMEGVARMKVGSREVTALLDGRIALPAGAFSGAPDEEIRALIEGGETVEGFINAFAVRGPDNLVLVDAGGGALVGPTAGKLGERLAAAGIMVEDIDVVLATHLHPDHVGGLIGENALKPPKAQLVLHEREREAWLSDERMAQAGERGAGAFKAARAALEAFGERVTPIVGNGDVPGGMESIELFGHTPGHTGFFINDGGESLLIWGDIIHAPAIQFARPDVTIAFDSDPEQARATRAALLDQVVTDKIPVAGMHLAFPAIGMIGQSGSGYGFEPL